MNILFSLFSVFLLCVSANAATINIGALFPTDTAGLSRKAAILAAVKDVNNNVLYNASFSLNITFVDSATATTANATQTLLSQGAVVLMSGVPTDATFTMLNVSSNIPIITSVANAPALTPSNLYPFLIRNIPSSLPANEGVARVILSKAPSASVGVVAIGSTDDVAIKAITDTIIPTLTDGGATVDKLELSSRPTTAEIDNAIVHLNSLSTRLWGVWGQNANLISFSQRLKAASIQQPYIIATTDVAFTGSFLSSGATDAMQNAFACVLGEPKASSAYTNFLSTYAREYTNVPNAPQTPDIKAAYVYDSVIQIANALLAVQNAGQGLTGQNIMNALRSGNASFITGQVNYESGSNDPAVGKDFDIRKIVGATGENIGTFNEATGVSITGQLVFPTANASTTTTSSSTTTTTSGATSVASCLFLGLFTLALLF